MRSIETFTWMLVLGAVLHYASTKRVAQVSSVLPPAPSAQREVDPTRWGHLGDQPIDWGGFRGNANREDSQEALALRKALAF